VDHDGARSVTRRERKIQVSENMVGNPVRWLFRCQARAELVKGDAGKYAPALKIRLDLAFVKDLALV